MDASALHRVLAVLPHILTASRLAATPVIFVAAYLGALGVATVLVVLAMATDLIDGPLIRRFGRPSTAGAYFDVWADFLTVFATFAGLALAGAIPIWPLLPIGLSFLLFLATSRARPTIYDPIGRYIGVVLLIAALVLLAVQDFVVQETLYLTVAISGAIGMAGRIGYLTRPLWDRRGTSGTP